LQLGGAVVVPIKIPSIIYDATAPSQITSITDPVLTVPGGKVVIKVLPGPYIAPLPAAPKKNTYS